MGGWGHSLVTFAEDLGSVPAPTRQLTSICNSGSRGSYPSSAVSRHYTHVAHTPDTLPGLRLPQELPEQWTNTKKLAIQVKQNVAPLQANEVNILRRKCQQFEVACRAWAGAAAAAAVHGAS